MAQEQVYDDQFIEEEVIEEDANEDSLLLALQEQWGSAPWYVSSFGIHCIVFLILLLIPVEPPRKPKDKVIVTTDIIEEEQKEEEPEQALEENDPEIVTEDDPQEVAPIIVTTDYEISDHNETADEMDDNTARGEPDNISTFDDIDGTPALMGVGHSGGTGGAGKFGNRGGGRRNLVARGGGSRRTEAAVDWALKWLKEHQEPDGHWDVLKYGGGNSHPPQDCHVAITSLSLLAFLGAGNSSKFGKYKAVVKKGVNWLKKRQRGSGLIGYHRYEGAIAMMAMAEAYGMSQDPMLRGTAQKCVDYAIKTQGPAGGWRYTPDRPLDVDTSVTGWWIMGLKSAKVAGLSMPASVMNKALAYFQQATMTQGAGGASVSYSSEAETVNQVQRGGGSATMTAISLVCLQFLGRGRNDPQVQACAQQVITDGVPNVAEMDFYRWYYCALGLFQIGIRTGYWERWNPAMVRTLLDTQVKTGTFKQNKGSWNYDTDVWGAAWGRVGQTALGALMLEVYYRYYNVHKRRMKKKGAH